MGGLALARPMAFTTPVNESIILTEVLIAKIEAAKVPVTDEWTDGLNAGLSWAQRILRKDKSAT